MVKMQFSVRPDRNLEKEDHALRLNGPNWIINGFMELILDFFSQLGFFLVSNTASNLFIEVQGWCSPLTQKLIFEAIFMLFFLFPFRRLCFLLYSPIILHYGYEHCIIPRC